MDDRRSTRFSEIRLDKERYTSGQVARLLGIPPRTIRRYLSIGKLPGEQNPITQTWHVPRAVLREFIEAKGGTVMPAKNEITALFIGSRGQTVELARGVADARAELRLLVSSEPLEGLVRAGVESPDIVIVDGAARVQGVDARSIAAALKINEATRGAKILVLAEPGDDVMALEDAGANRVLTGPVTAEILTDALLRYF